MFTSSLIYSANQLSPPYYVPGTRGGTDPTEMNRAAEHSHEEAQSRRRSGLENDATFIVST